MVILFITVGLATAVSVIAAVLFIVFLTSQLKHQRLVMTEES